MHGRVSVVGSRGNAEITPRDMMGRDGAIIGMSLWNTPPHELICIHAALVAGLENKTLRPVIGLEIPLAEAGRAHTAIMAGGAHGKIVLIP
jgi:NADPH2:quinone reductase